MKQKKWRKLMMAKGVGRNKLSKCIEILKIMQWNNMGSSYKYTENGIVCGVMSLECEVK